MDLKSDSIELNSAESNAVFLAIRHVDILKIRGLEFHHLFLVLQMRDPSQLVLPFEDRLNLFYDRQTRNNHEDDVVYYHKNKKAHKNVRF